MPGPTTIVDDIFLVTYDALYLGQQVMTTLAYRVKTAPGSPANLTQTYEAIRDKFSEIGGMDSAYADMFTEIMLNIKLHIQKVYPARWVKETAFSSTVNGTRIFSGVEPPANVAGALLLRSIAATPEGRGVKHIVATLGADVGSGEISATFAAAMQSFGDVAVTELTLDAPASGMVVAPVIYHRAAPSGSQQVDWAVVMPHSRIMRRRTVGLGT